MRVELAHDAGGVAQFPRDGLREVAVLGRSNVGKSSLINALVGRKRLARTSHTPGRTKRIHFYRVEGAMYLVDLPGFGFAAVAREERRGWRALVESYLRGTRESLAGAILLIDLRRGPEQEEQQLLDWLAHERIATAVAFTKSDRLSRNQVASTLARLRREGPLPERTCAVSARTGAGLPELAHWIHEWTGTELRTAEGRSLTRPGPSREGERKRAKRARSEP
jgi:GTP-binding protein